MKETIISASLVGVAVFFCPAPGYAGDPSEVSLYGVIDVGLASTHTSGQGTRNGMLGGGQTDSLWGISGEEALEGGWRATYQLESGFDPSNGMREDESGRLFNYNAWVGLGQQQFGELRLGRQSTIGQQFGSELEQAGWKDMSLGATFKASDNFQFDNTVNYLSPQHGGFQVGLGYSFNADDNGASGFRAAGNNRSYSVGLRYENGPWLAIATWDETRLAGSPAPRPRTLQLGVAYDFEGAKLALGWSRQRDGYSGLDGGDPDERGLGLGPAGFVNGGRIDAWYVGLTVAAGTGDLIAQWSPARPSWSWSNGERARRAQVASLGYVYPLSKRTTLYGFVAYASNYTADNQFDPGNSHTTRTALGITHRF